MIHPIYFYNTLTKEKQVFRPLYEGKVSLYSCGPTVYSYAHIGNMRANVCWDLLRRALAFNGYEVKSVMNITDVGHLVSDGDEGQDKMIVAMQREGKTAYEIAAFYEKAFMEDLARLNVSPCNHYPRATEHIPEQITLIKKIEENGFAYITSDGVYFDTSKLEDYGKLSGQSAEEKQAGARVEMGEKKNATDFALWKFSPGEVQREMEWESPWGKGFPGWHAECSAMSAKYLDVPFDIHTGGEDLVPVHHENELAQTQAADGVLQANYWLHNGFLQVDGGKMSKSLGNVYSINEIVAKGYDPLALRYFFMQAHYRTLVNFTFDALDAATNALTKLRSVVRGWDVSNEEVLEGYEEKFWLAINDDLNIPNALAVMWELVDAKEDSASKSATLLRLDEVLGLKLEEYIATPVEVPAEVKALMQERAQAREKKEWEASDALRDQIAALGYIVEDGPDGQTIKEK
jgi:cysteinyl-tRNA synthetase